MNIELQSELLRLKSILNTISDASYAYKTLHNNFRLNEITATEAQSLVEAYRKLISQVKTVIENAK